MRGIPRSILIIIRSIPFRSKWLRLSFKCAAKSDCPVSRVPRSPRSLARVPILEPFSLPPSVNGRSSSFDEASSLKRNNVKFNQRLSYPSVGTSRGGPVDDLCPPIDKSNLFGVNIFGDARDPRTTTVSSKLFRYLKNTRLYSQRLPYVSSNDRDSSLRILFVSRSQSAVRHSSNLFTGRPKMAPRPAPLYSDDCDPKPSRRLR